MRSYHCVITRDPAAKKRRRWLDGRLELLVGGVVKVFNVESRPEALVGTTHTRMAEFTADYEFEMESNWTCQVGEEIRSQQHQHQPPQQQQRQEVITLDDEDEQQQAPIHFHQQQQPAVKRVQYASAPPSAEPPHHHRLPSPPPPPPSLLTTSHHPQQRTKRTDAEILALLDACLTNE